MCDTSVIFIIILFDNLLMLHYISLCDTVHIWSSIISISPPPTPFKLDEWTLLCNNAITSLCERLCALCDIQWLLAQPRPEGKHGCSLLFMLLFHIIPCFINTMVIWLLLLLRSLRLSEWRRAQRASIDLRGSRDNMPLSPFLPCQSFMNASGGKVVIRELQQTIQIWTKRWKTAEP